MTVAQTDKVEPMKLEGIKPVAKVAAPAPAPAPAEEEEPPAPAPKRGRPPKAKVEEAVEEETAEPVVRKEEKPAPAAKSSLAKLAADWDDE